jgi:hypothetical protein
VVRGRVKLHGRKSCIVAAAPDHFDQQFCS